MKGRRRHRRWLRFTVLLGAVLVIVFYAVGGWAFSGKIESGALRSVPGPAIPPYDDVTVVQVDGGSIGLRAVADEPNLSRPELYGIAWDGGTGRLGKAVTTAGDVVTRPFTLASGAIPAVGQKAAIDRAYWLEGSTSLGLPVTEVTVPGPLSELPAWYFPADSSRWVICVHGQNGTRKDCLRAADVVHDLGYPLLSITYRNDEGTAPDPSGRLQYGQSEWPDLAAAVSYALDHGAEDVVLLGQSMGGAVVAAYLENAQDTTAVAAVIFDAAMLDFGAAVALGASQSSLPFGLPVPDSLLWVAERFASARYGVDWAAVDYLDDTSWLTAPTLALHGTDDLKVPLSVSRALRDAQPDLVSLTVVPGAGHVENWNRDTAAYERAVGAFLASAS